MEESMCNKRQHEELYGAEVDHIDHDGGTKYGTRLVIYFKNGKTLRMYAELNVGRYGIFPRIERMVGSWGKIGTSPKEPHHD